MTYGGGTDTERAARQRFARYVAFTKVVLLAASTAWFALKGIFGWWQALFIILGVGIIGAAAVFTKWTLSDAWREFLETNETEDLAFGVFMLFVGLYLAAFGGFLIMIGVT